MKPFTLKDAWNLAYEAHQGQLRRDGSPYIFHPLAVRDAVTTNDEKIVAILHDVFEDSFSLTIKLRTTDAIIVDEVTSKVYGIIPLHIAHALDLLTHKKGQSYAEYIRNIASSRLATIVKIADIKHNLSNKPTTNQQLKYTLALKALKK